MTQTKNYYTKNDNFNYEFYMTPKFIFTDEKYKSLSDSARILYIMLLSRLSLSKLNSWIDKQGRLFVYYTLEDVKKELGYGTDKAIKSFAELDSKNGVGLIERKRMGFGRPSKICFPKPDIFFDKNDLGETIVSKDNTYEKNESVNSQNPNSETSQKPTSQLAECRTQDFDKTEPNKININNNKFNNNDYELNQPQSSKEDGAKEWIKQKDNFESIVKNNISYDELCTKIPLSRLDEFVSVITHVLCSQKSFIKISDEYIPLSTVKERFLNLEKEHIEYVYDSFCKVESPIRNIRPYLITMLYQSDETLSLWIDNKRNIIE
ncbi:MAG: replication initiator protein A [Clostridia bacterium]|nr:replication initiator protein A [Clostridia bacterium]